MAGMPGCGKSLTAKATGSLFQLPLVKLDIGSLLGKYVGESEANMKKALRMAEQVSPCVLWIDEIEKAFSGVAGSSGGGSEVTTRLFGLFLSWMQEKPSAVFVIATANNVSVLPPELLRKGRFDEIFYVDFPNMSERQKILEIHLKDKRTSKINYEQLAEKTEGYTGSDIEGLINDSLEKTFVQGGNVLSNEDIITVLSTITPLKESLKDSIEEFEKTFENFKLKPASFDKGEHQQLLKDSKSRDPVTREMVADNENCPVGILEKLIDDSDANVKKAVIKNPNCPSYLLENIMQSHHPQINWSESFTWSDNSNLVDTELFELALNHPGLKEEFIENLYADNKVSDEQLIEIVQKRKNLKILLKLFDGVLAKSPSNINKGVVRTIHITQKSIISKRQKIISIDDETGENREITFPYDGLVKDVIVLEGDEISAGQNLVKILVPKKKFKRKKIVKKYLLTWYGITDLRASLGIEKSNGPILSALLEEQYSDVVVLAYSNSEKDKGVSESEFLQELKAIDTKGYQGSWDFINKYSNTEFAHNHFECWLKDKLKNEGQQIKINLNQVFLKHLNDTESIYEAAIKSLDSISGQKNEKLVTLYLSPGTPVMAFVWAFTALSHPEIKKKNDCLTSSKQTT
ncbi:MAG: AAA family ATPase [Gammaproteobacteria bacterium]|nr:AAA family ATPase [Gammaproteobacteria bacterium]